MKTILIFSIAFICVTIAKEDEVRENGALVKVVDGMRILGRIAKRMARMLYALSAAFEILIFVIIKKFIDVDFPNQIFANFIYLLQIFYYFSLDSLSYQIEYEY